LQKSTERFNNGEDTMGKRQLFSIPRVFRDKSPAGVTVFELPVFN